MEILFSQIYSVVIGQVFGLLTKLVMDLLESPSPCVHLRFTESPGSTQGRIDQGVLLNVIHTCVYVCVYVYIKVSP